MKYLVSMDATEIDRSGPFTILGRPRWRHLPGSASGSSSPERAEPLSR